MAKKLKCAFLYNVLYNIFSTCYNVKFASPCPQKKLHDKIHKTAQDCTMKCAMCSKIKFIENLICVCVCVCSGFVKQIKIKFPSSVEYSKY